VIDGPRAPVNKLAALGMVGDRPPGPDIYRDESEIILRKQAKSLKKKTGEKYTRCLNVIAESCGFRDWNHYVDFKKRKGEWTNDGTKLQSDKFQGAKKWS
jgi:hypothetical protein